MNEVGFGVQPKQCEKCGSMMKFHDIVYKNFGSVREKLKKEYENDIKNLYILIRLTIRKPALQSSCSAGFDA